MGKDKNRVSICGIPIDNLPDSRAALDEMETRALRHTRDSPLQVNFINAHVINTAINNIELFDILNGDELNLADGIGIWLGGAILSGVNLENLNGTDLGLKVLAWGASKRLNFFFLGAKDGIAGYAKDKLCARIPGLRVVGSHNGYFDSGADESIINEIIEAHTDILFVCMGVPSQELWISHNSSKLKGVKAALALGAFFDFYADSVKRAPRWMIKARIEWVFRLCQEPQRLWKRYIIGNFVFMCHILECKLRKAASGRHRPGDD